MNVRFDCPFCEHSSQLILNSSIAWQCPNCERRMEVAISDSSLSSCPLCGSHELYKRKDFPHGFGLAVLTLACVASVFTYGWYEKWLTWAILIGTAAVDGLLYLWVGDAIICYRCQAQYRGINPGDDHKPFELAIAERYRQERLRREQIKNS